MPTFVLASETDRYFAWTVDPPLTAAFIGGGYWAGVLLVLLAARSAGWAGARIAIPGPLVFALLTLLATLLHFDRFHEDRPITWAWVAIYVLVPALLVVFTVQQLRSAGGDPPLPLPLPGWAHALLAAHAVVLLPLGVALFVAPDTVDAVWPWPLSELTARIVAAWLVGIGVAAAHGIRENDWVRLLPGTVNYAAFGVLQLLNLARYPGEVDWDDVATWLYVTFVVSFLGLGLVGIRRALAQRRGGGFPRLH